MTTLNFNLNGSSFALPILREGFSINRTMGAMGRHATSSVAFMVRPGDGANLIATANSPVHATITEDNVTIATGIVRPYLTTGYNGTFKESVSMELLDLGETMHVYVWPTPTEDDPEVAGRFYPHTYKDTTLPAFVAETFSLLGITADTSPLPAEPIYYLTIAGGDYMDEVVNELLFEYGWDYTFDPQGVARFVQTFAPDAVAGEITDIRGNVSFGRSDDTTDGVIVNYSIYKTTKDVVLRHYINEGGAGFPSLLDLYLEGYFYNGKMHDSFFNSSKRGAPTKQSETWDFPYFKDEEGNPIPEQDRYKVETSAARVKASLTDEKGVTLTPYVDVSTVTPTGALAYIKYKGHFDILFNKSWGFNVRYIGDVTHRAKGEEKYRINGPNPDHVDLRYAMFAEGSTYPRDFARKYYTRQKAGKKTLAFATLDNLTIGGYYRVGGAFLSLSGLSIVVRIVGITKGADGIYTVKAECATDPSIVASVETIQDSTSATSGAYYADDTAAEALKVARASASDLMAYKSIVTGDLEALQAQIDGAIETYTGDYVPTLSNAPANAWGDNAERDKHIGDLFIVDSNGGASAGFLFRFMKEASGYSWVHVSDNEIQKALADAAQAKSDASAAQANASTAITNASSALSTAQTASADASQAKTDASDAKTSASTALSTAQTANANATSAVATATSAESTAASALSTAQTASADATTAKDDASTAKSNASTALNTANNAAQDASTAITTATNASNDASSALTTANAASANASTALETANTASTTASNAAATANTASEDAASALESAQAASADASTAKTNASTAITTANSAAQDASDAKTTANTASQNAASALSVANTANTAASNAVSTANTANTTAANALTTATTALEESVTQLDVEYYLSTSATALAGGSWSTVAPVWEDGKYMWSRQKTTYGDGSSTYSNQTCIAGAKGSKGDPGNNGRSVKVAPCADSLAQADIDAYSAPGATHGFTVTDDPAGYAIGDEVICKITNSTKGCPALIPGTITSKAGSVIYIYAKGGAIEGTTDAYVDNLIAGKVDAEYVRTKLLEVENLRINGNLTSEAMETYDEQAGRVFDGILSVLGTSNKHNLTSELDTILGSESFSIKFISGSFVPYAMANIVATESDPVNVTWLTSGTFPGFRALTIAKGTRVWISLVNSANDLQNMYPTTSGTYTVIEFKDLTAINEPSHVECNDILPKSEERTIGSFAKPWTSGHFVTVHAEMVWGAVFN